MKTYSNLIFNAWGIEEWLDFLPQFPPWPCAQLQVATESTLDNSKSKTLFLQLLEDLTGKVTTSPGLHPWHDTAKTIITEFFHLTQDTSTEEDLNIQKGQQINKNVLSNRTLKIIISKGLKKYNIVKFHMQFTFKKVFQFLVNIGIFCFFDFSFMMKIH